MSEEDVVDAVAGRRLRHYPLPVMRDMRAASVKAIEIDRIVVEHLPQLVLRRSDEDLHQRLHPSRVRGGVQHDRPLAAEHDPVETEALYDVIDVGLEVVQRPGLMVGLGHHAGQLAAHVGYPRQLGNFGLPRPIRPDAMSGLPM